MDDPWGNAWASTSNTTSTLSSRTEDDPWTPPAATTIATSGTTWEPPAWPSDDYDDGVVAVWNTGATNTDDNHEKDSQRNESEPVRVENDEQAEEEREPEPLADEQPPLDFTPLALPPSPPPLPVEVPSILTSSPILEEHAHVSPHGSPDGFGTFETAQIDDSTPIDNAWAGAGTSDIDISPAPAFSGVAVDTPLDGSRSLWGAPHSTTEMDDEGEDEWSKASARQRLEEERERNFPREAVNAILERWDELADDLWPKPQPKEGEDDQPSPSPAAAVFESRLESIPGLPDLISSLVPDYHLQPAPQFAKTGIFSALRTSLRTTKNFAVVQQGPLAQFYSSKGTSAWESSVRAAPSVQPEADDWPWAKPAAESAKIEQKLTAAPAKTGILGGLWGKRPSSIPPQVKQEDASATGSRAASPRPSMDSQRSSTLSVASRDIPAISTPVAAPSAPSPIADSSAQVSPSAATAPSAVSRFLGRFSRKSTVSTTNSSDPDSSLTLSSDDLSFLSDVGPGHSPSRLLSPDDDILGGLSSPSAGALLSSKLPPALQPPPRNTLPLGLTKSTPPGSMVLFDDDEDDEFQINQGVAANSVMLDALMGGGMGNSVGFDQGYAPLGAPAPQSSRGQAVQRARSLPAPSPAIAPLPPPPAPGPHRVALPSSVVEREQRAAAAMSRVQQLQGNSTMSPSGSPAPRPPPKLPPPNPMFAGEDFENFLSSGSTSAPAPSKPGVLSFDDDDFGDFAEFASPQSSPPQQAQPRVTSFHQPRPPSGQIGYGSSSNHSGSSSSSRPPSVSYGRPASTAPVPTSRTPVAVMRSSSALGSRGLGTPPPLLPPPGSSGTPVAIMARASRISAPQSDGPAPLLAPPPGMTRRTQHVADLLGADTAVATPLKSNALADLMGDTQSSSTVPNPSRSSHAPSPVSPTGRTHPYGQSPPLPPIPPAISSRSINGVIAKARPNAHVDVDAAWGFDDEPNVTAPVPARPNGAGSFSLFESPATTKVASPPPLKALSPPPGSARASPTVGLPPPQAQASADMFALFGGSNPPAPAPVAAAVTPVAASGNGKKGLSAADLSFFEGL
ncbi:hypothetical protein BKA62DRAFT_713813 [Auriculariales sp. MPI-PUGE-AT-0066]|nr:hypothetical protein BKA62DRAFT_713813 [Auriculariales sp. MPI-PUGE-AT-0066]